MGFSENIKEDSKAEIKEKQEKERIRAKLKTLFFFPSAVGND